MNEQFETLPFEHPQKSMASHDSEITIAEILLILRRHKGVIWFNILFFISLTALYLFFQPPIYSAKTYLQVNVRANKVVNIESVVASISGDESAIVSELDIIRSRSLAERVVNKLKLYEDPEFKKAAHVFLLKKIINSISDSDRISPPQTGPELEMIKRSRVVDNFLNHLKVSRTSKSYTITVEFSSIMPAKAQKIANTIAEEYIASQIDNKFEATQKANEWLSSKLQEIQKNVVASEQKVQQFKQDNNLLETGGQTLNDQGLSELNSQLIMARAARSQAESKLANAKASAESAPEVLNSGLIQALRGQETELLRRKADLSNRYGPKHPKMINLSAEHIDLNNTIRAEIGKIIESLESEVLVARNRENTLEKSLAQAQGKSEESSRASVEMAEMTREMNANRVLYESFLSRFKQTSETGGTEQSDARIISYAEVPIESSYPKVSIFMVVATMTGLMFGIILAFIIESLDKAFRKSEDLENKTGLSVIGMIPEQKRKRKETSSIFHESLKTVFVSMNLQKSDKKIKKIMVTSSVPEEGKSYFSLSFAIAISNMGRKVLLIDADMKRSSLTAHLMGHVYHDYTDVVLGNNPDMQVNMIKRNANLDFLPVKHNIVNSQEIIGSEKMAQFIEKISEKYDYVIFDTPPVMAVSDSIVTAKMVDKCLFVVRWGKTPKEMVKIAIKNLMPAHSSISLVMTRVDLEKHKGYESGDMAYYYSHYSDYYTRKPNA